MKSLLLLLLLSGCATRYLTVEEDQDLRARCEQGCVVMPATVLEKLLERLRTI